MDVLLGKASFERKCQRYDHISDCLQLCLVLIGEVGTLLRLKFKFCKVKKLKKLKS